jgi:hypothetical protein
MDNGRADNMGDRTPLRRIGFDDNLWERFEQAVKRTDPDSNRSANLRRYVRWFVGDIDEIPQRPAKARDGS